MLWCRKTSQHFILNLFLKNGIKKVETSLKSCIISLPKQNIYKGLLYTMNITTNLLNLQAIIIDNFIENENSITFFASTKPSKQICPHCGQFASRIHGYRTQMFKDLSWREKFVYVSLKKRRYICSCGKTFFENYPFLPKYHRATSRFFAAIINKLHTTNNQKVIAKEYNISSNTVARILKLVSPTPAPDALPEILAIDEFKGNTNGEKYHCILTDPKAHKLIDILPDRKKTNLISYFKAFKNRDKVKFFVMDMTGNYKDIAWLFPNAKIIVDKFHWIRQIYWALDRVRKRIQKQFHEEKRKYFKTNRKLLLKRYDDLDPQGKEEVSVMVRQHDDLYRAWLLKEYSFKIKEATTKEEAEKSLFDWIMLAEQAEIPEFKTCLTAYHNWSRAIINSIVYGYSNGYTEGTNNLIKVIKRNAYGYHKFENLRKRIFLVAKQNPTQAVA